MTGLENQLRAIIGFLVKTHHPMLSILLKRVDDAGEYRELKWVTIYAQPHFLQGSLQSVDELKLLITNYLYYPNHIGQLEVPAFIYSYLLDRLESFFLTQEDVT